MKRLNAESEPKRTLSNAPIAVLQYEYGKVLLDGQLSQASEQMKDTPFGPVSSFQLGKISFTTFKLDEAEKQCAVCYNNQVDTVQLVYVLEGGCTLRVDGVRTQQLHSGEHHRVFLPKGSIASVEFAVQGNITLVIVGLEQEHFLSYLPPNSAIHIALINECSRADLAATNLFPLHIMPDQFSVLHSIIDCKRHDFIRHHYISAKIDELMVLYLEQSVCYLFENQHQYLRDEELHRIYKVRDMLRQEPEKSYSLVGLAHAVGTNDATLKKHFKQVFGTTVFAYLIACRMELAKSLLLKNNQKVATVAQEVGYKYASHFSTAFRKYFGYLPTKLLRSVAVLPADFLVDFPFL